MANTKYNIFIFITNVLLLAFVCGRVHAVPFTGEFKLYFHETEYVVPSLAIDINGVFYETGDIKSELDLTNPLNSFELYNFDTMTVIQEIDIVLTAPFFADLGVEPITMHTVETGTFEIIAPIGPVPGSLDEIIIKTNLIGTIELPASSIFSNWTWNNKKEGEVSIEAGAEMDEEGKIKAKCGVKATWKFDDHHGTLTNPNGTVYSTGFTGSGTGSACPVPEPSTMLLLSSGLIGIVGAMKKLAC